MGLATTAAWTAGENKITYVSILVKKTGFEAKISSIESKYITTADYNKFPKNIVANKIKNEGLVDQFLIDGFIKNADLDKKVVTLGTKADLKAEQQNYKPLIQVIFEVKAVLKIVELKIIQYFSQCADIFKKTGNTDHISSW